MNASTVELNTLSPDHAEAQDGQVREPVQKSGKIEILTRFARRKWFIAKGTFLCAVCGVVIAVLLPTQFTASTKVMPPQQTPSSAMMMMSQSAASAGNSVAALATSGLSLKNPDDIYIGLLNSRPVADAIIGEYKLEEAYRAKDMTDARRELGKNTSIVAEKSGMITVAVTDRDGKRAADLANAYTDQLRNITQSLASTEAAQRKAFYEGQLKEARDAVMAAETRFQQVQETKGVVAPEAQAKAMIEGIADLRAEIMAKQVQIQAMRSFSTSQNPQLQLAENQLASLQSALAKSEEHGHSAGFANLGLEDVPSAGMEYLSAEHDLLYRQTLLDLLVKQYDASRLDEAKEAAIIQVVEPAIPPERKTSPHRAQITLVFLLLGFLGSCVFVHLEWVVGSRPEFARSLSELRAALLSR